MGLIVLFVFLNLSLVYAENDTVHIYVFHSQGCPHCANAQLFLDGLEETYPSLETHRYELHVSDNYYLLAEYCDACNVRMPDYVPIFFIDGHKYESLSNTVKDQIRLEVEKCLVDDCVDFESGDIINFTQGANNNSTNTTALPPNIIQEQNDKFEVVGWSFIISVILVIIYFVIKKLRG